MAVIKIPRSSLIRPDISHELSSAREEGTTPFVPPVNSLIIRSPDLGEIVGETE